MSQVWIAGLGSVLISGISPAWSHGVDLQAELTQAIAIQAQFDSGEPMGQARVTVYSPQDPATPWQTGTTDDQGHYTFVPDQAGEWEVTVRQAGHGDVLVIPVSAEGEVSGSVVSTATTSPLQRGIMVAAILWGCVGTALFFSRRTH